MDNKNGNFYIRGNELVNVILSCGSNGEVVIPEGITKIRSGAFVNVWHSMTRLVMPQSLTQINNRFCFCQCEKLTNVVFGDKLQEIGEFAFDNCSNLKNIILPPELKKIGDFAFAKCGLTKISIPSTVTQIGEYAFANNNLTEVTIPSSVIEMGKKVFVGCKHLTKICIDKRNAKYDSRDDCNAIIETDSNTLIDGYKISKIPKGVEIIDCNAFSEVDKREIKIPYGVKVIKRGAFARCKKLKHIILPNSLERIEMGAFKNTAIREIFIPSKVTHIAYSAFVGCKYLKKIVVDKRNKVYDSRNHSNAIIETKTNKVIIGCKNTKQPPETVYLFRFWGEDDFNVFDY